MTGSKPAKLAQSPNRLLNALAQHLDIPRDAGLARELGVSQGSLTRIRNGEYDVVPRMILRIYDRSGWSIEHIRKLAGIEEIEVSYERYVTDQAAG